YEDFPLENCFINVTGLGNSETGLTNSSGMIDFTLTPSDAGFIVATGELAGYLSSEINIPVRLKIVILPSIGTADPENCCWDELMLNWDEYGDYPLEIDYTTFQNASSEITFENLDAVDAQVVYSSLPMEELTESEIDAIQFYVQTGKGFIASGGVMYLNPNDWSTFFGLEEIDVMDVAYPMSLELDITNTSHSLVRDVPNPYSPGFIFSMYPSGTGWSPSILRGAGYAAVENILTPTAALIVYHGMVYLSNIPEYFSNQADCQLIYNAMVWSDYVVPEHDLAVSLEAPSLINPGSSTTLNVTTRNTGLNTETSIHVQLFIDGLEVDSKTIPSLAVGATDVMSYLWTPSIEGDYNITAFVTPVLDEDSVLNNLATKTVPVRALHDYIMVEDVFMWYDAVSNGDNIPIYADDVYFLLDLPFEFPFYDGIFDSVAFSTNGWLSFQVVDPYESAGPTFPTSDIRFANAIAPLFADLRVEGNLYYWATPDWFVVQYENYNYYSGAYAGTFQVVIHRNGQLSFNYQTTGDSLYGQCGLNRGDGVHYNSYPILDLSGESAFGLQFYYNLPEHELVLGMDCPSQVLPSDVVEITMYTTNIGTSDESNIDLELFIDDVSVFSTTYTTLDSGVQEIDNYFWTASILGVHNISAVITTVPDEFSLSNNIATQIATVTFLMDYIMTEDTFTWYDAEVNGVNIGLSGDDESEILALPFDFTFYDTSYDWIAVSSNGWLSFVNNDPREYMPVPYPSSDASYAYSLAPIWADLLADSNIYYWATSDRAVIEFNDYCFLGGDLLGTFQVVLHASGTIEFNYLSMENVFYGTVGLNHGDGVHYNSYSYSDLSHEDNFGLSFSYTDEYAPVWVETPDDFVVEAGEMFDHNFEVYDENGIAAFTVNNTEHFSLTTGGLLSNRVPLHVGNYGINITATDPSDNSVSACLTVMVRDTVAPSISDPVTHFQIETGTPLSVNLTFYDFSGVASYEVNDTRFAIDEDGLLTNAVVLPIGNYSIEVSVTDVHGNTATIAITVAIYQSSNQAFLFYAILTFSSVAIGGLIIILILRRRLGGSVGD
ncbi:MAG: CARDB domain-containing protein, partial [Candidatus Thorarchaeota archaeon]